MEIKNANWKLDGVTEIDAGECTLSGPATLEQLRELTALQAEDPCLWAHAGSVGEAYAQQALRYLTHAIEGEWPFEKARDAIKDMMP